ncbi:unnamed protein product [Closterium sp. NIES-54]
MEATRLNALLVVLLLAVALPFSSIPQRSWAAKPPDPAAVAAPVEAAAAARLNYSEALEKCIFFFQLQRRHYSSSPQPQDNAEQSRAVEHRAAAVNETRRQRNGLAQLARYPNPRPHVAFPSPSPLLSPLSLPAVTAAAGGPDARVLRLGRQREVRLPARLHRHRARLERRRVRPAAHGARADQGGARRRAVGRALLRARAPQTQRALRAGARVGDGQSDHSCWQRPEDMTTPRTAYRLDPQHPGTEPAAEAAAALAASSMVFGKTDANYSKSLLTHARQVRCSPMRGRCAAHPCAPGALLTHARQVRCSPMRARCAAHPCAPGALLTHARQVRCSPMRARCAAHPCAPGALLTHARQSRLPCSPHPPLPPSCQPSNPWHQLFNFARKYPKKYTDSIPSASAFYNSYSGFNDELLWAAVWLYRATGERRYLDYIVTNEKQLGGTQSSVQNFSWDNKYAGAQVLLAKEYIWQQDPSLELYLKRAKDFVCGTVVHGIRSPGGMLFLMSWSNLQYVTAISMVLSAFADILDAAPASAGNATAIMCDSTPVTPTAMRRFVKRQVDYILGVNPKKVSYMVGFSSSYPQHVHHRGASLPSIWVNNTRMGCNDGWPAFQSKVCSLPHPLPSTPHHTTPHHTTPHHTTPIAQFVTALPTLLRPLLPTHPPQAPNVNVLTGAVIGGPDSSDAFRDERDNYQQVEPSTSINAPFVGVLARVAGGPPKASPPPASPKAPPPPLKAPPPPPGGKRK